MAESSLVDLARVNGVRSVRRNAGSRLIFFLLSTIGRSNARVMTSN